MQRRWRLLFPVALSLVTCGLMISFGSAIAQTIGTGWFFNSQSSLNKITLAGVQDTGECASNPIYPSLSASFISEKFEYVIKQRDRLLETGTFTAIIDTTLRQEERRASWGKNEVCANSSVSLNVCADKRIQRAYQCPDGKILKAYLEPDDSRIFTRIYNETDSTIEFRVDGYRQEITLR